MASQTDYEKYEIRLKTFNTWPRESVMYIKDLVEAGFSYTGESDFVFCCCCQLRIGNWKNNDDPVKRHEAENSFCPYLLRRRERLKEAEAKYGQEEGWQNARERVKTTNVISSNTESSSTYIAGLTENKSPNKQNGFNSYDLLAQQNHASNRQGSVMFVDNCTMDVNMDTDEVTVRREPKLEKRTLKPSMDFPKLIIPQPSHDDSRSNEHRSSVHNSPRTRSDISPTIRLSPLVHSSSPASSSPSNWRVQLHEPNVNEYQGSNRNISEQRNAIFPRQYAIPGFDMTEQRFNIERSTKAADMSNKSARLHTFFTWPQDIPIQPLALAEAGFYYLMKDDGVKCYKCDIALRDWKYDDIPWVEHEKWSPRCPLVKDHSARRAAAEVANRPTQSPLSSLSYALPSEQTFNSNTGYGLRHEAPIEVQSGFHMIGHGNVIITEVAQRQNSQNSQSDEIFNHELPLDRCESQDDIEYTYGPLSDIDIGYLLDAGFTLDTLSKVQKLSYQQNQSYFDSVETTADAIMYFLEHGSLEGHSIGQNSSNNMRNNNDNDQHHQSEMKSEINENSKVTSNLKCELQSKRQDDDSDLKRELERVRERQTCKICMDEQVGVVFFPCKHLMTCPECSVGLQQCPLCRATIESSSRIYLS